MKIQTDDEVVTWRGVTYLIDRENELAFTPSQVRDAGSCHRNLMRRGKISTSFINVDEAQKAIRLWRKVLIRIGNFGIG